MHNDPRTEDGGPGRPLPEAAALARRDRRIAELADDLEAALRDRDALAETVQARFDELASVTATAESYRAAAERTAALEDEVAELRAALAAVETSLSWRITAPLRWLRRRLAGG